MGYLVQPKIKNYKFGEESQEDLNKVSILLDSEKKMIIQEHRFYDVLINIRASIESYLCSKSIEFYPLLKNQLIEISGELISIFYLLERLGLDEARFEKEEEKWILKKKYKKFLRRTAHSIKVKKRELEKLKFALGKAKKMLNETDLDELFKCKIKDSYTQGQIKIIKERFAEASRYIDFYDDILTKQFNEEQYLFEKIKAYFR